MTTAGSAGHRRKQAAQLAIGAVPLLLLIVPALHYSLDTPVGLFDRRPYLADKFDSASNFLAYLRTTFVETIWHGARFRPFFEVWTGLVWKLYGDAGWPHHFSRWVFHFGAAAFFISAFKRVARRPQAVGASPQQAVGLTLALPVALLAYLWLLFPNVLAVRIEDVELHTIFFLGLCNWAAALILTAGGGTGKAQALFCLGFLGLLLSKEVNVAPALWLLLCWWAWAIAKGASARKLLVGAALTLALLFTVHRVSAALENAVRSSHYVAPTLPISDRFPQNAADVLQGLLQTETSVVVTAAFILLLLALAVVVASRLIRRRLNGELAFVLLVLGEFASMFLVLCLQYGVTLRYWSVLVPCLATLLAFAAKFLLEAAKGRKALANGAALALAAFIAFFVAVNYYNFLYQVVVQHSARNLDDLAVAEVAQLLNNGEYVQANPYSARLREIGNLRSMGSRDYAKLWPNSPYGPRSIHGVPPKDFRQPYYFLDIFGQPALADSTHVRLVGRVDYGILSHAEKAASLLQGGAPHVSLNSGMHKLGKPLWAIYALPHNTSDYLDQLIAQAGEPVAQSVFDVYFDGKTITYVKKPCLEEDIEHYFFLHLAPVRLSDLPGDRRRHEFDNLDFLFGDYGIKAGATCLGARTLPPYPIKSISTGQYVMDMGTVEKGTRIWETDFSVQQ